MFKDERVQLEHVVMFVLRLKHVSDSNFRVPTVVYIAGHISVSDTIENFARSGEMSHVMVYFSLA